MKVYITDVLIEKNSHIETVRRSQLSKLRRSLTRRLALTNENQSQGLVWLMDNAKNACCYVQSSAEGSLLPTCSNLAP